MAETREELTAGRLRALLAEVPDQAPVMIGSGCCGCALVLIEKGETARSDQRFGAGAVTFIVSEGELDMDEDGHG